MSDRRVGIVGAGSWGTALAAVLADNGHEVRLWSYEATVARQIQEKHENVAYLSGVRLPDCVQASTDLHRTVADADIVVSVSPSQFVRSVMREAAPQIGSGAVVVSASKGIEITSLKLMDEVLVEALGESVQERLCVISGPSFASEVARQAPTALVAASGSPELAEVVQRLLQNRYMRIYTSDDVVGVELGGALKNVIALAAGMAAGLGFGHNTQAALITRGLAEMSRLGVSLGAKAATFAGLAGMGDLVLTCTGELSRNRTVGYRRGRGESLDSILGDMHDVAEGVETARAVHDLAGSRAVEMPISEEVYLILVEGKDPGEALRSLMARDPKPEHW